MVRKATLLEAESVAEKSGAAFLTLAELRRSLDLTQVDIARQLECRQEEISRIEQRTDLRLSTLRGYVQSLGGELELVCRFKDRDPVRVVTPVVTRTTKTPNSQQTRRLPAFIRRHADAIVAACRRYAVRELAVFGSVLRADFDPTSSDIDFAVHFDEALDQSPSHQYFDFKAELEQLFARPVDLVELDAMPSTRLKRLIVRTQVPVYGKAA
jgi:predicted nucleotidyltransferase